MIHRLISDSVTTAAKRLTGTIGNVGINGVLIGIGVGGSGHVESDFSAQYINATIRQANGEDIPLIQGLRIADALKLSDFKGGFSLDLEGDDGTRYVAYLPVGRVKLEGDDVLDVEVTFPGDASATYAVVVSVCDLEAGPDAPMMYELITGNAQEQLIRDVYALYHVTTASGASIYVKDEMGKSYTLVDTDVIDLGNALGEMESYEEIGAIYTDPFGLSQDVRLKLPASTYAVAVRGFFDPARLRARSSVDEIDASALLAKIAQSKPHKARFLQAIGKGA